MGGITPQNEVPVFRRLNKASRHTFCPISPKIAVIGIGPLICEDKELFDIDSA